MITMVRNFARPATRWFIFALVIYGTVRAFVHKDWRKGPVPEVFSLLNVVGLIFPIGSVFLALRVSYGLLEFVGVFMQPIMRPIRKAPSRSAIDAVASFVDSHSIGLMITDRVYLHGCYSNREAVIVATGFSTVFAACTVIVANSLGIMEHWLILFFVSTP